MPRRTYYEGLFKVGGLWNLLAAAIFLVLKGPALAVLGMQEPTYTVFYDGFFVAVLLFGIGYYQVGRNLDQNRAVVLLGAIGKVAVFLLFLSGWRRGELPGVVAILGTGDLVFALLFFEFLRHERARSRARPEFAARPAREGG